MKIIRYTRILKGLTRKKPCSSLFQLSVSVAGACLELAWMKAIESGRIRASYPSGGYMLQGLTLFRNSRDAPEDKGWAFIILSFWRPDKNDRRGQPSRELMSLAIYSKLSLARIPFCRVSLFNASRCQFRVPPNSLTRVHCSRTCHCVCRNYVRYH